MYIKLVFREYDISRGNKIKNFLYIIEEYNSKTWEWSSNEKLEEKIMDNCIKKSEYLPEKENIANNIKDFIDLKCMKKNWIKKIIFEAEQWEIVKVNV